MKSMSLKDDLKCRKEDTSFYLKSLSPLSSIALMSDSLYLCLPPISIGTMYFFFTQTHRVVLLTFSLSRTWFVVKSISLFFSAMSSSKARFASLTAS